MTGPLPKALGVPLVFGDPLFHLLERNVTDRKCLGGLKEKSAVAQLCQHHGMLGRIEAQGLADFRGKGDSASFGDLECGHAVML